MAMTGLGSKFVPNSIQRLQQSAAALAATRNALLKNSKRRRNLATRSLVGTTTNSGSLTVAAAGGASTVYYVSGSSTALTTSSGGTGSIYWSAVDDNWNLAPAHPTLKSWTNEELIAELQRRSGAVNLARGKTYDIKLPDGTRLKVSYDGSFQIVDKDAKVTYKASRFRDFNPFINASDKMEAFIDFCANQGVTKEEMAEIPVKLFINWLIIEAAKADKETPPDLPLLPAPKAPEPLPEIWI